MKVVVAEDNAVMLRLLASMLTRRGHEVATASDGEAAWSLIERTLPPLVVLDGRMPGLDGLDVCRRIRANEHTRHIFILVITGRDLPEDLEAAIEAGVDDYLQKPATAGQLFARFAIAERRVALEQERREAVEALAQARWLAGVGETALALQHEINNPLAALLGHIELLRLDGSAPSELRDLVSVIAEQSRRIGSVIQRLGELKDPRSVDYHSGARMLDLSSRREPARR